MSECITWDDTTQIADVSKQSASEDLRDKNDFVGDIVEDIVDGAFNVVNGTSTDGRNQGTRNEADKVNMEDVRRLGICPRISSCSTEDTQSRTSSNYFDAEERQSRIGIEQRTPQVSQEISEDILQKVHAARTNMDQDEITENTEICFEDGQIRIEDKTEKTPGVQENGDEILLENKIAIRYFDGQNVGTIYVPVGPNEQRVGLNNKDNEWTPTDAECYLNYGHCIESYPDSSGISQDTSSYYDRNDDYSSLYGTKLSESLKQSILEAWSNVGSSIPEAWDFDLNYQPDSYKKCVDTNTPYSVGNNQNPDYGKDVFDPYQENRGDSLLAEYPQKDITVNEDVIKDVKIEKNVDIPEKGDEKLNKTDDFLSTTKEKGNVDEITSSQNYEIIQSTMTEKKTRDNQNENETKSLVVGEQIGDNEENRISSTDPQEYIETTPKVDSSFCRNEENQLQSRPELDDNDWILGKPGMEETNADTQPTSTCEKEQQGIVSSTGYEFKNKETEIDCNDTINITEEIIEMLRTEGIAAREGASKGKHVEMPSSSTCESSKERSVGISDANNSDYEEIVSMTVSTTDESFEEKETYRPSQFQSFLSPDPRWYEEVIIKENLSNADEYNAGNDEEERDVKDVSDETGTQFQKEHEKTDNGSKSKLNSYLPISKQYESLNNVTSDNPQLPDKSEGNDVASNYVSNLTGENDLGNPDPVQQVDQDEASPLKSCPGHCLLERVGVFSLENGETKVKTFPDCGVSLGNTIGEVKLTSVTESTKQSLAYDIQSAMRSPYPPIVVTSKDIYTLEYPPVIENQAADLLMGVTRDRMDINPLLTGDGIMENSTDGVTLSDKWLNDCPKNILDLVGTLESLSGVTAATTQSFKDDITVPRVCSFTTEDVNKMVKEIQDMNFVESVNTENEPDKALNGKGDFDDTEAILLYETTLTESEETNILKGKVEKEEGQLTHDVTSSAVDIEEEEDGVEAQLNATSNSSMIPQCSSSLTGKQDYATDSGKTILSSKMDIIDDLSLSSTRVEDDIEVSYGLDCLTTSDKFNKKAFYTFQTMDSEAASVESNVSLEGEEIVLQVINNDDDEDDKSKRNKETGHIRFSLFNEVKYPGDEVVEESDCSDDGGVVDGSYTGIPLANRSEKFFKFVENQDPRKVKSGLTTVGPMKNLDYDPRDLCSPEIDYGKMTPVMSKTLTPENRGTDSLEVIVDGNETILPLDDGFLIVPSREIASLTNIKKVREAMYHCNSSFSEEDIDPNLSRPDLKKMASVEDTPVFDGQLTVPIIPLDKESSSSEIIENVQSILSGSHVREKLPVERNYGRSSPDFQEQRDIEKLKTKSSQFLSQTQPETSDALFATVQKDMELRYKGDIDEGPTCSFVKNSDIQSDDAIVRQKSSTLTRVMRKASDKLNEFKREVDDAVRSTKSLPRNTNKIKTGSTISLKSLVEDCQTAGTNMLQKSRSVLKSTQNLIKSLSQPKVVDDNSIDLEEKSRMLVRDDKDYRIERIENFKRFESVKKSCHKGGMNVSRDESDLQCNLSHIEGSPKSFVTTEPAKAEQAKENQTTSEKEIELSCEENMEEECLTLGGEGDLHPPTLEEDFIMMETIHGVYDSEKQKEPSAECSKDLFTSQRKVTVRRSRGHLTGVDTTSSSSNRRSLEVLTEHIGQSTTNNARTVHATPSKISLDLKKRRKKKKIGFSSKFKRFWRSAFDKVKISPRKTQQEE